MHDALMPENSSSVDAYWQKYLDAHGLAKNTPFYGECAFGTDADESTELLSLVLLGKKQANCSALASFHLDNESLPVKGARYVLTDWAGKAWGIIQTIDVKVLPYNAITWEMAQKEGSDDTMESWIENHNEFFAYDSSIMGYDFTPDMPVVFETFALIYR